MSSIAVPTPTEGLHPRLVEALRAALAIVLLTALFVTFTPFEQVSDATVATGDTINQIGYATLAALALAAHLAFTDRRVALSLLRPAWLLMAGWLVFSAFHAPDPTGVLRSVAFTLAAMVAVTGALCLPATVGAFRTSLATASLVVLGLSYLGVVAVPSIAVHQAVGPEAIHAGLWRGIYSHKNFAGAVMAALFFVGFYLVRCRWLVSGTLVMLGAFVFVLQTGSKTSALLLPLVAALVLGCRIFGGRRLVVLALVLALAGLAFVTLGAVVFPAVGHFVQWVMPGTTFTGRFDIWSFAIDQMRGHLWTGFGYESFWRAGYVLTTEPSHELAWDPRGTPNAHNGYLDMALATGLPGLLITVLVVAVLPLKDFVHAGRDLESRRLAETFLMILVFGLMNAFLESFLFDRANVIWITLWLAVVGLHLLARSRLAAVAPIPSAR